MDTLLQKFCQTPSCRSFGSQKISDADIEEIIEFFRHSASMLNLQPWKIFIISNPILKLKLQKVSANQIQVAKNSHYIIFARRKNFDENFLKKIAHNEEEQKNLQRFFDSMNEEQQKNWAISQVSVALGSLLPFLTEKNIDNCPIGVLNREKYDEILDLSNQGFATVFGLAIGYKASDNHHARNRLEKDEICKFL